MGGNGFKTCGEEKTLKFMSHLSYFPADPESLQIIRKSIKYYISELFPRKHYFIHNDGFGWFWHTSTVLKVKKQSKTLNIHKVEIRTRERT